MIVMLKPRWPGAFHRNVRDENGDIIECLVFVNNERVELTDEQFEAVRGDIGHALMIVSEDGKPDRKGTADAVNGDSGTAEEITMVADSLIPEPLQKKLLAEGIDKLEDLAALIDLGPDWFKGVKDIGEASAKEIVQALKLHEAE